MSCFYQFHWRPLHTYRHTNQLAELVVCKREQMLPLLQRQRAAPLNCLEHVSQSLPGNGVPQQHLRKRGREAVCSHWALHGNPICCPAVKNVCLDQVVLVCAVMNSQNSCHGIKRERMRKIFCKVIEKKSKVRILIPTSIALSPKHAGEHKRK